MASITFAVDKDLKPRIERFSWVKWSELAKEELSKRDKLATDLRRFKELASKSKLTKKDAFEFAEKISKSMHDSLVKNGLI